MTDPQSAADATAQPASNSSDITNSAPPSAPGASQSDAASIATENAVAASSPDGDLPEWEPLSPEIVEDEAIRGDFMLRWAVVLLALLLGCRQLVESSVLVHIKTGQHILSNGYWPPAKDVFSFTASDRPWINLSWLFDVLLAGLHGLIGPAGVSVAVGCLAAVATYWLVNIGRKNIPTWWTALCVGVGLLTLQIGFVPLPRLITLLGTAWFLKHLVAWSDSRQPKLLWCLVGSLVVWTNLDSQAYVGWLLLAAYASGTLLANKLRRIEPLSVASTKSLAIAVVGGLIALLINPNGWHAWASPFVWYGTEVPAARSYAALVLESDQLYWFPAFDRVVWGPLTQQLLAAVVLVGVALVTTIMNRRRADLGLFLATLIAVTLGVFCVQDLATAIVAAVVLASLNGQEWYRDNCRQTYSIDTLEVLYSRGGRAVTVLAFAVVAYMAISGRLMGRDGKRVGIGFAPQLEANVRGTIKDFEGLTDARIFNFRPDQGDLLIWAGQKPFIDSRMALFATGSDKVTQQHETARMAIRRPNSATKPADGSAAQPTAEERKKVWSEIFERHQVTHLAVRMWGISPAFSSFNELVTSPTWILTRLGSTVALFHPRKVEHERGIDFRKTAFDECVKPAASVSRAYWPKAKTGYQQFLSLAATPVSNDAQHSRNALQLVGYGIQGRIPMDIGHALGLSIMAVRDAQAALAEEPTNIAAYVYLSDAYSVLSGLESQLCAAGGARLPTMMRNLQSIGALRQALTLEPDNPVLIATLVGRHASFQQVDLAIELIERFIEGVRSGRYSSESDLKAVRQFAEYKSQQEMAFNRVDDFVKKALEEKVERLYIAGNLRTQGFPKRGLQVLEEDRAYLATNLPAQLMQASLLVECGRLEDAAALYDAFSDMGTAPLQTSEPWQLQAAFLATLRGDYERAEVLCRERLKKLDGASVEGALMTSPMTMPMPELVSAQTLWPLQHVAAASQAMGGQTDESGLLRWTIAICQLESSRCGDAVITLQDCLRLEPSPAIRILASEFLASATGKPSSTPISGESVPVLFADGTGDPEPVAPAPAKQDAQKSEKR